MKRLLLFVLVLPLLLSLQACDNHDHLDGPDYDPPARPTGLTVLNGDQRVDLAWNYNRENDVDGYNVYVANTYNGKYQKIGTTSKNYFVDEGVSNGKTYYYAVTAFDYSGNESDLSEADIHTTPRPEGFNVIVMDFRQFPSNAGFGFYDARVLPYNDKFTDVYFDIDEGVPYLCVYANASIKDMGVTNDIYDIAEPPLSGWSTTDDAKAIVNHTYVILNEDGNYAKMRVTQITPQSVKFDWAYQTVAGNPDLQKRKDRSLKTTVRSSQAVKN
jgi:hypothetical protein